MGIRRCNEIVEEVTETISKRRHPILGVAEVFLVCVLFITGTLLQQSLFHNQSSLKHLFDGIISKILEADGLRAVVQYDIVGVRYARLHKRVNLYASQL